jgi:hypothetical protein
MKGFVGFILLVFGLALAIDWVDRIERGGDNHEYEVVQ